MGRVRRNFSDEELITLALERYAPLRQGMGPTKNAELAKKYGRDEAVITRAITSAFEKRLVDIVRLKYPAPLRLPALEEQLLSKFPKLHVAIVIDGMDFKKSSADERAFFGDKLHEELGKAMAHFISTSNVVRDNDTIGIGSGRGVFFLLTALSHFERLRAQNVTAVSLTGDVYARTHAAWRKNENATSIGQTGLNCQLDADDHLSLLGMSLLWPLKETKKISHPIAWERGELIKMIKKTILDADEWKLHIPDLGLVGVGVLSDGHRLYQEVKAEAEQREQRLDPIIEDLKHLASMCEFIERPKKPWYVPVGDICNRLFYVRPPEEVKVTRDQEGQIVQSIQKINEKLLTASEEQLAQIKELILIAGTLKKAPAIKQLLEEDKYNIRVLCTDKEAATEILGLERPEVSAASAG
ncbi:MAG TPA: sugar-binding domain-containing protein [Pyrinomonadaceae bacterium]|nr:sugar-binding domain-containing protein [Pyrinomonadaceae bacterium]